MFLKQSYPPDKKSVSSLTKQPIQEEIKYPAWWNKNQKYVQLKVLQQGAWYTS